LPENSCAEKKPARSSDGRWRSWGSNGSQRTSPQAKGRIERLFATLQDRLVKEMRLAGIDSIASRESLFRDAFSSTLGRAFHGGTA